MSLNGLAVKIRSTAMPDNSSLHTIKAHATTVVGAGGAVYAADQLVKCFEDDDESTTSHLMKASVGAAVAVGAYEMLSKDNKSLPAYRSLFKKKYSHHHHHEAEKATSEEEERSRYSVEHERTEKQLVRRERSSSLSSSASSSSAEEESGHKRRLAEELVGAYSLGKQLLGDKKHRITHLVADAVGAAALLKEVNLHDLRNK